MKPFDILALGELNVDLILNRIEGEAEVGKEIFARDMLLTLGSSTAIFAANAAALGARVAFVGMIGDDSFGQLVQTQLARKGVDTSTLIVSKQSATGATIVMNYGEDRANVTYPGAMSEMGVKDLNPSLFTLAKHVHISSVFLQEQLLVDLKAVLEMAKSQGVTVSMDTQWDPSERWALDYAEILPLVDVFLPNEKELMAVTHTDTIASAVAAVRPYIHTMVVKCGTRGSLLVTGDTEEMLPAFLNCHTVDAIGAGDSFNAGFISRFVDGDPLAECQRFGNLTGALNTTAAGGTGAFTTPEAMENTVKTLFNQTLFK